jgi:hypothetical protein
MSLDQPAKNKMMTSAPAKKEFHFAATAEHYAEVIYAESIQEAEQIYQNVRRLIKPAVASEPAPLSTAAPVQAEEDVQ